MKRSIITGILLLVLASASSVFAKQEYVDSLSTINPELRKYFPRWKVCEPDLQFQIYQAFHMLGFEKNRLDIQDIEVLASPKEPRDRSYDVLLVSCGDESINARQIDAELKTIGDYLSGRKRYRPTSAQGPEIREYCFQEIPVETPVKPDQGAAIADWLEPTNVMQAMTLSLFDQSLKIGETGFWLHSKIGTDEVGYPHWTAGEAKFILKRPLYVNNDPATNKHTPYLINAYLGGAYKISSGLNNDGTLFAWLPGRSLNSVPSGKLIFGFDVHMPFHPNLGLHFNIESPLSDVTTGDINDPTQWGTIPITNNGGTTPIFFKRDGRWGNTNVNPENFANIFMLGSTGQVTLFYDLWLNRRKSENYFRFDLGVSYAEIQQYLMFTEIVANDQGDFGYEKTQYTNEGVNEGFLQLFHPNEFADWLYANVEYRNQAVFPFSASIQYSNQTLLTRAYLPLFGDFLLLEAKYARPLRDPLPFENEAGYFVISPVLRITL